MTNFEITIEGAAGSGKSRLASELAGFFRKMEQRKPVKVVEAIADIEPKSIYETLTEEKPDVLIIDGIDPKGKGKLKEAVSIYKNDHDRALTVVYIIQQSNQVLHITHKKDE